MYDSEKVLMNELELEGLSVETPLSFLSSKTTSRYTTPDASARWGQQRQLVVLQCYTSPLKGL